MFGRIPNQKALESKFRGPIKEEIDSLRQEFLDNLKPIKADLDDYHKVAFHKFTFLFHRMLMKILDLKAMHTTSELIESLESINSRNYELNKKIKATEDEIMKEKDKTRFLELVKELESQVYKRNYFSLLERNVVSNNLIYEMGILVEKVNHMEFSGEEVTNEDVREVVEKSEGYMGSLLDTAWMDKKKPILGNLLKGKEAPVPKDPVVESHHLSEDTVDKLRNELSGDFSTQAFEMFIDFVNGAFDEGYSFDYVRSSLVKKGWPEGALDKASKVIQEQES